MPDGRRRSREHWTDTMEAGPPNPPAHVHRLPPVVRIAVVGLVGAVFLLLVAVAFLTMYVYKQQQYIQGKGEQRDAERAQLQEQQRRGMCDLLDQLPEGGLLERPRAKYHCGPGIPLSQLTPSEQAQIQSRNVPAPPPQPLVPLPPPASSDMHPTPGTLPPRTGPGPGGPTPTPPSPAPASPTPSVLDPVTGVACGLLGCD